MIKKNCTLLKFNLYENSKRVLYFYSTAGIAQLGERQTEDLKVACSIHAHRIFLLPLSGFAGGASRVTNSPLRWTPAVHDSLLQSRFSLSLIYCGVSRRNRPFFFRSVNFFLPVYSRQLRLLFGGDGEVPRAGANGDGLLLLHETSNEFCYPLATPHHLSFPLRRPNPDL